VGGGEPSETEYLDGKTHTRDEKGWHTPPVLPAGMTERVNANGNGPTQGDQVGMWSMALAYPRDDDGDKVDP
jgi:hypothetical protein